MSALLPLLLLAASVGTEIGDRLPQFTAELTGGGKLDSHKPGKPTVWVFLGTKCPATAAYLTRFKELESVYGKKGVQFVYLYPNKTDPADAKRAFHREHGLGPRMVDDEGGRIARLVAAERTSEVLVTDRKGTLLYRGGVDDNRDEAAVGRRFVATALDEHLAGKKVTTPRSQVFA